MSRKLWLLVAGLVLLLPTIEAAAEAAPSGPRLAIVRQSYPQGTGRGPFFDLLTTGPFGGARSLITGGSVQPGVTPTGGISWSPDGETLAIAGTRRFEISSGLSLPDSDLFLISADGTGLRQLTTLRDAASPVYSADGATVYFARYSVGRRFPDAHSAIWAVGTDGTGLRQLTAGRALTFDVPSSVSPSGDELAFTRTRCKHPFRCGASARALSVSTGVERRIAKKAGGPVFSPDGSRIALSSFRDRNGEIRTGEDETTPATELYVQDAARGRMHRLTRTEDLAEGQPSWDPSGQRIAFTRGGFDFATWTLQANSDGSCKRRLLPKRGRRRRAGGNDFATPVWQPGPGRAAGPIVC